MMPMLQQSLKRRVYLYWFLREVGGCGDWCLVILFQYFDVCLLQIHTRTVAMSASYLNLKSFFSFTFIRGVVVFPHGMPQTGLGSPTHPFFITPSISPSLPPSFPNANRETVCPAITANTPIHSFFFFFLKALPPSNFLFWFSSTPLLFWKQQMCHPGVNTIVSD